MNHGVFSLPALFVLAAGLTASTATKAGAEPVDRNQVVPGEYLVRRSAQASTSQLLQELHDRVAADISLLDELPTRRLVKIRVPQVQALGRKALSTPGHPVDPYVSTMISTAALIGALPSVEALEPVSWVRLTAAAPDDVSRTTQSIQAVMNRISLPQPGKHLPAAGIRPLIVAVIDSGVMLHHEVFKGLILDGVDVSGGGRTAAAHQAPDGQLETHGTAVAGLIAIMIRGGTLSGKAGSNIRILPIRATGEDDDAMDVTDVIKAIDIAVSQGARIINAGWGKDGDSPELHQALQDAAAAGVVIVAAAGNGRQEHPDRKSDPATGFDLDVTPYYPASWHLRNLLTVTALGPGDALASFANRSASSVSLAAPGEALLVPCPLTDPAAAVTRSGYQAQSGTSLATALVTGSMALLRAAHPDMDAPSLVARAMATTSPLAPLDKRVASGGILSVKRLLDPAPTVHPADGASAPDLRVARISPSMKGKWIRQVKWPLSAGPIPAASPLLRGMDAGGTSSHGARELRVRVHLDPDTDPKSLQSGVPAWLGAVNVLEETGDGWYRLDLDTVMDTAGELRWLRALPGVIDAESP